MTLVEMIAQLTAQYPASDIQFSEPEVDPRHVGLHVVSYTVLEPGGAGPVTRRVYVTRYQQPGERAESEPPDLAGAWDREFYAWVLDLPNRPWDAVLSVQVNPRLRSAVIQCAHAESPTTASVRTHGILYTAGGAFASREIA